MRRTTQILPRSWKTFSSGAFFFIFHHCIWRTDSQCTVLHDVRTVTGTSICTNPHSTAQHSTVHLVRKMQLAAGRSISVASLEAERLSESRPRQQLLRNKISGVRDTRAVWAVGLARVHGQKHYCWIITRCNCHRGHTRSSLTTPLSPVYTRQQQLYFRPILQTFGYFSSS